MPNIIMRFSYCIAPALWLFCASLQADEVTVYKWRDQQGHWHYGEKPPKAAHEELNIDTEANVTNGNPFAAAQRRRPAAPKSAPPSPSSPGLPYTPGHIRKMLDDIKNIDNTVKKRNQALDRL